MEGLDDISVAHHHSGPEPGGTEGLRDGVKLPPNSHRPLSLQKAGCRPATTVDVRVGGIRTDDDVIDLGPSDQLIEIFQGGHSSGRITWGVDPADPSPFGNPLRNRIQINQEAVFSQEWHVVRLAVGQNRPLIVNWVGWVWADDRVATIDERQREVTNPFLT